MSGVKSAQFDLQGKLRYHPSQVPCLLYSMRYAITAIFALFSLLIALPADAQTPTTCQPIFGGGESCITEGNVTLDKILRSPTSNQFVDQTNISGPKFSPDQPVVFQLMLKNTGNRAIEDITVTDIFPRYASFTRGPGQFDRAKNTLTFRVDRLEAGQSRTITLEGKIMPANALPGTNTSVTCVVNQAIAEQGRNRASDNAEFCLQKVPPSPQQQPQSPNRTQPQAPTATVTKQPTGTMPVYEVPTTKTSPTTGPELLGLIGLVPAAAAGFYLRRKTS